jgi:hypothetical protein
MTTQPILTLADFASAAWEKVLDDCKEKEIFHFAGAFRREAFKAENNNDAVRAAIFYFLYEIASIGWEPDSTVNVFRPQCTFSDGKRTRIPSDYSEQEAELIRDLVATSIDPEIRARLADVAWERKRYYPCAKAAVEAYLESAASLEDPVNWSSGARRLARALNLARMLRSDALTKQALSDIETTLDKYNGSDPSWFSAYLMELLLKVGEGDPAKYAVLAANAAKAAEAAGDWRRTRAYLEIEAKWCVRAGKKADAESAMIEAAETYIKEADLQEASGSPSYMLITHHLECAIKLLRTIGGQTSRVQELIRRLLNAELLSLSQLRGIEIPLAAPSESLERARNAVAGKTFHETLVALISIHQSTPVDVLRGHAREMAKAAPLSYSIAHSYLTAMGKVAAKTAGGSAEPEDNDPALRSLMLWQANALRTMAAQLIEGARLQIALEHAVSEHDWDEIVSNNPFVPVGRERLFTRGLHAGLVGDFVTAAHLLIPQLENSCREILARAGVIVSTYDADGIQRELYIHELLRMPEFKKVFGDALAFDMRSLLVEQESSNLRHATAHGLYAYDAFQSPASIYLWWLILRLVVISTLQLNNSASPQPTSADSGDNGASEQLKLQARAAAQGIREMSKGVKLGGLKIKDLISEGRL